METTLPGAMSSDSTVAPCATDSLEAVSAPAPNMVKLQFSDGRADVDGLENVNAVLRGIGVHASALTIPEDARPILEASRSRPISEGEQTELIALFHLHRGQLLTEIERAGRTPVAPRGGYLSTMELDTQPYPKIYDMKALSPEVRKEVLNKYGRLHVNTSDNGMGIDEVMTVVSGGPFTWVFVLPSGTLVRLTVDKIDLDGPALRLSYPGLGMHAGYMDPEHGLIVAFAHGPKDFVVRFEDPSIPNHELLGTNGWVDFTGAMPRLRSNAE